MNTRQQLQYNFLNTDPMLKAVQNIPAIPELFEVHDNPNLVLSTQEETLDVLVAAHDVAAVVGAHFGDEGKGKMVDAIARNPEIEAAARLNSGANAGHTLVTSDGTKRVFHLMPSAIATGIINIIHDNCVMDPVDFYLNEVQKLVEAGISYENLFIGNPNIVTSYHKILDALGAANSSTLRGMSPVHMSKVGKKGLRLNTLFQGQETQEQRLEADMRIYNALVDTKKEQEIRDRLLRKNEEVPGTISDHVIEFLEQKDKISFLIELYAKHVVNNEAFPKRANTGKMIQDILARGGKILAEAAQAYRLANNVETDWSDSTSADTTLAGTLAAAGYNITKHPAFGVNVQKHIASRVGNGKNIGGFVPQNFYSKRGINTLEDLEGMCEDFEAIENQFFDSVQENGILNDTTYTDTNGTEYKISVAMAIATAKKHREHGATTKKPRVTGLLDLVSHAAVNRAQGPYASISAVDRGDLSQKVGVIVAYVVSNEEGKPLQDTSGTYTHGQIIRPGDPLPNEEIAEHFVPIIKVMEGWKDTPIGADKGTITELPDTVRRFVSEFEHYTGAQTLSIGNGPKTEELLYIGRG